MILCKPLYILYIVFLKEDKRSFYSPNRQRMIIGKMLATNVVYRVLNVAVVFAISVILSRIAGVAGYGLLSLLIANAGIFNLLSAFGADAGITFHSASGLLSSGKLLAFIAAIILFQAIAVVIVEAVSWFGTGHLFLFKTNQLQYAWLGGLFLLSISLIEKYSALLSGNQLFSLINKTILASNLIMLGALVALYLGWQSWDLHHVVMVYVLLTFLQALFLMFTYHNTARHTFRLELPRKEDITVFFSYSMFTLLINVIQFLAYRIDYWLLDHYKGEEELGWYSLAVRLAQLFWVIPLLLASIIFPVAANKKNEYDEQQMLALIRALNMVNLVAGVVLFFIAPFAIPLLFGQAYTNSVVLLQLLLPGVLLFCVATILAAYFGGQQSLSVNFYGSLLCLVTVLLFDLLWIPSLGMKGAAMASSIGYGVTALYFIVIYCYRRKTAATKFFIPQRTDLRYIRGILRSVFSKK
jgi:O-antigen/teichoic acid export membrane protein